MLFKIDIEYLRLSIYSKEKSKILNNILDIRYFDSE